MQNDIKLQPIGEPVNAVIVEQAFEPTRWIAGANSQMIYEEVNPSGIWLGDLISGEKQNRGVETWGCTNFWGLSSFEMQIEWQRSQGTLSDRALRFLSGENCAGISYYDDNGKTNLSDKFTFIKTGTRYGVGNYVDKTPYSVRHDGAIPEKMLPFGNPKTWNEFADPAQITELMEQLGHEFAEIFEVQYESLPIAGKTKDEIDILIKKQLKQCPLSLAIAICPGYSTDNPVNGCSKVPVHCVGLIARPEDNRSIYDSYPEYVKYLANDYNLPYILKSIIFEKTKEGTMELIKIETSPHIYLLSNDKTKKILLIDMPTLESLGQPNIKTVSQEEFDKYKDGGTLVWANRQIN